MSRILQRLALGAGCLPFSSGTRSLALQNCGPVRRTISLANTRETCGYVSERHARLWLLRTIVCVRRPMSGDETCAYALRQERAQAYCAGVKTSPDCWRLCADRFAATAYVEVKFWCLQALHEVLLIVKGVLSYSLAQPSVGLLRFAFFHDCYASTAACPQLEALCPCQDAILALMWPSLAEPARAMERHLGKRSTAGA